MVVGSGEEEVREALANEPVEIVSQGEPLGTAAGSFYFAMDYVSGQPLDTYMASRERPIEETLKGFYARVIAPTEVGGLELDQRRVRPLQSPICPAPDGVWMDRPAMTRPR